MSNQLLRRVCVRALINQLHPKGDTRPVALGCKLARSNLTMNDVAAVWAEAGADLRLSRPVGELLQATGGRDPLRDLLVEYRAVMRERSHARGRLAPRRSGSSAREAIP